MAAEQSYIDHVSTALAELKLGKTREACGSLKLALTCNSEDPLAHTALGLALLMGGLPVEAGKEFQTAGKLSGSRAEPVYGQGLVSLSKGDIAEATALFCRAHSIDQELGAASAIAYTKFLAGATYAGDEGSTEDDAALALRALSLGRNGGSADALEIWKSIQPRTVRPGFREPIGCTMTFLRTRPMSIAGWPIGKHYTSIADQESKLPSVSGRIALRADISRTKNVALVSFFVDEKLVGVTNRNPFEYSWDTAAVPNGVHTVRILGTDSNGATISEKTAQVVVRNIADSKVSQVVTGPEADKAWTDLRSLLRLKPSASAVNYHLARCALDCGDKELAIGALERVMAADPDYPDAADRLSGLMSAIAKSGVLHGVSGTGKTIAITFDDGPKPESSALLDLLKQKGVKATFFVVGKQVEAHPDTLLRMISDGHEIQNHTYGHRALEYLSPQEIQQELFACAAAVRSVSGKSMTMLRPPGARHGAALTQVARRFGLTTVFWTANCAKVEGTNHQKMTNFMVNSAKPGAILLMHNADRITLAALPAAIDALKSRGYAFVTLSELIASGASGAK